MRILFALPGFHRFERGAEVALLSLATELARGGDAVTVIGAGEARAGTPYRFRHAGALRREKLERMPRVPALRSETGERSSDSISLAPTKTRSAPRGTR